MRTCAHSFRRFARVAVLAAALAACGGRPALPSPRECRAGPLPPAEWRDGEVTVAVLLRVGEDRHAEETSVCRGSGQAFLDAAAMRAARSRTFGRGDVGEWIVFPVMMRVEGQAKLEVRQQ